MAKTIFISEEQGDLDTMASHVGYDLTQNCSARDVLGTSDWLVSDSFKTNATLKSTLGLTEAPVTDATMADSPTADDINSYIAWEGTCYDTTQTWLNGLDHYHIWAHKGDCWTCDHKSAKVLTLIDNADAAYVLTKSGLEWLVYTFAQKLYIANVQDLDTDGLTDDMDLLETYIIDNYTGVCAEYVTKAKEIDTELATLQTALSGKANVTQITLDDLAGNKISTNTNYANLTALYNA